MHGINLNRQGRLVGPLFTGAGNETIAVGSVWPLEEAILFAERSSWPEPEDVLIDINAD